ncbi:hypothetical protein KI688_005886 [Linnemannia hyalina]|uniref:Uncharacterized protein n=1 Tax=Linnemannia hyalina TaxID=64524 RepID=A0A9P7Y3N5_9FUNG|nr:hypothetical protein KI688_005886 [Linnemannia hyalina]
MDPESGTKLSSTLDRETMPLFPELSNTLNNGNSNIRQKNGGGSGSGNGGSRRGNKRIITRNNNTNTNTNTSTSSNNNNNNNIGTHIIDHPIIFSGDDDEAEQEEEEERSLDAGVNDSGQPRIVTGLLFKPDVQQFLVRLSDFENARRYLTPRTTGTTLVDVQREVASIVNAVMAELLPSTPPIKPRYLWNDTTVRLKFRYIKAQYDKCVKLTKVTGNGGAKSSTLTADINDISPFYHELVAIFGAQLTRNHPPLRDSPTPSRAPFFSRSQTWRSQASRSEPLLRKELKQAKVDFQTEKAHHLDDVTEFRYKNNDREALVKSLAKHKASQPPQTTTHFNGAQRGGAVFNVVGPRVDKPVYTEGGDMADLFYQFEEYCSQRQRGESERKTLLRNIFSSTRHKSTVDVLFGTQMSSKDMIESLLECMRDEDDSVDPYQAAENHLAALQSRKFNPGSVKLEIKSIGWALEQLETKLGGIAHKRKILNCCPDAVK